MNSNEQPEVHVKSLQFIHITKNAGTSIEKVGKLMPGTDWGKGCDWFNRMCFRGIPKPDNVQRTYDIIWHLNDQFEKWLNDSLQIILPYEIKLKNVKITYLNTNDQPIDRDLTLPSYFHMDNVIKFLKLWGIDSLYHDDLLNIKDSLIKNHNGDIVSALCEYNNVPAKDYIHDIWHIPISLVDDQFIDYVQQHHNLFCVIRNPYTRVLSEYYCKWNTFSIETLGNKTDTSDVHVFNSNLKRILQAVEQSLLAGKILTHWAPQSMYYMRNGKPIMPENNILRFESLEPDLTQLCERHSLPYKSSYLQRHNACVIKNKFKVKDIDRENLDMINHIYREDFKYSDYKTI